MKKAMEIVGLMLFYSLLGVAYYHWCYFVMDMAMWYYEYTH